MPAIKFAFISFLVLWMGSVSAQKSLASTSTFKVVDVNESHMRYRVYAPGEENEFQNWGLTFNTRYFAIKKLNDEDLNRYTDEHFFDSIITNYNASNFEAMLPNKDTADVEENKVKENFFKLLRRTYGVIENKTIIQKELVTLKDSKEKSVIITYIGNSKNIRIRFSIMLDVTKRYQPHFVDMRCTPFDYNSIPFFSNISALALEYIRTKNTVELVDGAATDFQKRMVSVAKLEKSLTVINCDSLTQFTSNLILQGHAAYARVVYDMLNTDQYLALVYISEDNKFKLYDLGFIDKKKE